MTIKVLTLTQPWATLVAIGAKRLETRSWPAHYRGPLAIHAGKGLGDMTERAYMRLCAREPFRRALTQAGYTFMVGNNANWLSAQFPPRGAIIAVCELTGCFRTDGWSSALRLPPDEPERSFGDYSPNRYVWRLENVCRLETPIPAKGRLGLWEFDLPEMAR